VCCRAGSTNCSTTTSSSTPIVYTPQEGKAITTLYLQAAGQTLPGEPATTTSQTRDASGRGFHYTKHVLADDTAVLEFETTVEGKYVNGVDIIRCNDEGRIVEFRVMIRPLQAVNLVHQQMAATLERMKPADWPTDAGNSAALNRTNTGWSAHGVTRRLQDPRHHAAPRWRNHSMRRKG